MAFFKGSIRSQSLGMDTGQWYFPLTGLLCRKRNVPLFTCCMGTGKTRMSGPV